MFKKLRLDINAKKHTPVNNKEFVTLFVNRASISSSVIFSPYFNLNKNP